MSPFPGGQGYNRRCFPRVSGDEPNGGTSIDQLAGFSPRERG